MSIEELQKNRYDCIFFDENSTSISNESATKKIKILARFMANNPNVTICINGYDDKKTGTANIVKYRAETRAKNVYDALISAGVAANRLTYVGYDSIQPYGSNDKMNRVVICEFKNIR